MSALYHVILADDDPLIRNALAQMVKAAAPQLEIIEAHNGAEALWIFNQRGADLIISDNQMPVLGGLDLIRALRDRAITVPILLLSGDPAMEAGAYEAGATFFLQKPFIIRQIRAAIARALPL